MPHNFLRTFFIKVKRNNVYKDINERNYNNILYDDTMFSLDPYIEPTDHTSHRGALLKINYSLTNLFSDEQGRMLKSHLCVRGNKAQTSHMAMVYKISTEDRNRFAIQRKRQ